jgi:hypothetical protein
MNYILDFDQLFDQQGKQKNMLTDKSKVGSYSHDGEKSKYLKLMDSMTVCQEVVSISDWHPCLMVAKSEKMISGHTFNETDRTIEEGRHCLVTVAGLFASVLALLIAIALFM